MKINFLPSQCRYKGNKPSQKQLDAISILRYQGYQVNVIWDSVDEVISTIIAYLGQ